MKRSAPNRAVQPGADGSAHLALRESTFRWTTGEQDICLLLEGDLTPTPAGGWPIRKDYRFGCGLAPQALPR